MHRCWRNACDSWSIVLNKCSKSQQKRALWKATPACFTLSVPRVRSGHQWPASKSVLNALGGWQFRCKGSWARTDGQRPNAVVVHPRVAGSSDKLAAWDAAEALALGKALRWRVVGVDVEDDDSGSEDASDGSTDEELEDAEEDEDDDNDRKLRGVRDLSIWVSDEHIMRVDRVDPRFFFSISQLTGIAVRVARTHSDVLFINNALTASQQRHIEAVMDLAARARRKNIAWSGGRTRHGGRASQDGDDGKSVAVFDRTRVVLAIFARRATTTIARMQIQLAEAQQAKVKLGAAALQGVAGQLQRVADVLARRVPGCDKSLLLAASSGAGGVSTSFNSSPQITRQKQQRAIAEKEKRLKEELSGLQNHRGAQRQRRGGLKNIVLVGYTNVGKSAVVNRLTGSDLLVQNGVFVTLDLAARRVPLPSGGECYIMDSVGFVRDLPTELFDAFQAVVEELQEADLILHVRDLAHPSRDEHLQTVTDVLTKADIDIDRRVLEVWNKADLLTPKEARYLQFMRGQSGVMTHLVSALNGDGFEELLQTIDRRLHELSLRHVPGHSSTGGAFEVAGSSLRQVRIPGGLQPEEAAERWRFLREHCSIVEESITADEGSTMLSAWMDSTARSKYDRQFGSDTLV